MSGLIASIERRPQAAFGAFLVLHFLVWTALPALVYPNLPLDLIEALTYGREWQLGYDKLPPLPWWMIELVYRTVGVDVAFYALAQLAVLAAFALVWATARPLVGAVGALVAVLILDGMHYFNYTAAKFNHDVIQLPLWALAGYAFHAGLKQGRTIDWVWLGLAVGVSLWAKYFVVVLAVPLALFLLIDRDARKALATPGPWIAFALAALIMLPHLVWLVRNDFLPFAYASARAAPTRGLIDHVIHPVIFAGSQVLSPGSATIVNALANALTGSTNFAAAGGLNATTGTFANYAAAIVSNVANKASQASAVFTAKATAQSTYANSLASESGVNIDEETTRISSLQNKYAAASELIQVINTMFNSLITAVQSTG